MTVGSDAELAAEIAEGTAELERLRRLPGALHTRQVNRCALSSEGLLLTHDGEQHEPISFRDEWNATKAAMKAAREERRALKSYVKDCERELSTRKWERECDERSDAASATPWATVKLDEMNDSDCRIEVAAGWDLPTEQPAHSKRDLADMSKRPSVLAPVAPIRGENMSKAQAANYFAAADKYKAKLAAYYANKAERKAANRAAVEAAGQAKRAKAVRALLTYFYRLNGGSGGSTPTPTKRSGRPGPTPAVAATNVRRIMRVRGPVLSERLFPGPIGPVERTRR